MICANCNRYRVVDHNIGWCDYYDAATSPTETVCNHNHCDPIIEDVSTCDYPDPVVDDDPMPFLVL